MGPDSIESTDRRNANSIVCLVHRSARGSVEAPVFSNKASSVMGQSKKLITFALSSLAIMTAFLGAVDQLQAQGRKPNIVFIMGDDIGMWNIGAYHRGMMAGRTPNLDKLAKQGMMFTDYYAEASCTAGRANFITGQLPIRT